ncbi:M23 family metallopeptidase [Emticicia sp. BO119]|uniref:peptidoglycan DD-metalloendopeptidase family protein n=1 Tax=Emticicia sp. BO119 TaxID=2757768 RepID=UPI0015F0306E|nr:M23 family metallopeptidase [Emticicia sp. BO119]MBA4849481.1 peptidoglycan DD-metalloendopeptidase family protein [Emticicia sp. BO119]
MKKKTLLIATGIAATVAGLFAFNRKKSIVSPLKIRVDSQGNGNFGASRTGFGKHYGIDLVVTEGQKVYAPFSGSVNIIENALSDKKGYKGVRIFAENNLQIDVLYIIPAVANNSIVKKGQLIGYAQNITKAYNQSMLNHIHVEHYDRAKSIFLNPTDYYFGSILTASSGKTYLEMTPEEYANYVAHQFE